MSAPALPYVLFDYITDATPKFVNRLLPNQPEFEDLLADPADTVDLQLDKIKITRMPLKTIFISRDYVVSGNRVEIKSYTALARDNDPLPVVNGLTQELTEQIDHLVKYRYLSQNPDDPADDEYGPSLAQELADKFSVYGYSVDFDLLIPKPAPHVEPEPEIHLVANSFVAKLLEQYPCPRDEDYGFHIDTKTWTQLMLARARRRNVLLVGPTGTGKTELIDVVAKVLGQTMYTMDMGTIQDAQSALLGVHRIDHEGHSKFDFAPFVDYLKSGQIVLSDEINRAPLSVQNMIFPTLDRRRHLPLDIAGSHEERHIKLHENTWMVATANIGSQYGATNSIDEAFMNRFQILELTYLPAADEVNILMHRNPGLTEKDARAIVSIAGETRTQCAENELSRAVSTRHTLATAEQVVDGVELLDALNAVMLPLYDDEQNASEREKVRALFAAH